MQISNAISNASQQQIPQQQMLQQHGNNQISLEILRPSSSGQITLYPMPQIPSLHTTIMDSQMYNNDNIPTSSISSTHDSIQHIIQRLENLKVELENKEYFQNNCDEFYNYLQNDNVYSACQDTLVQCLKVCIYTYYNESIKLVSNLLYIIRM
jgi:hypothetical protein